MMDRDQTGLFHCPSCQIGYLRAQKVLYFNQRASIPVIASDFPGWVCDLCGYRAYDPQALSQLQAMLSTNRGFSRSIQARTAGLELDAQPQSGEQRRRP